MRLEREAAFDHRHGGPDEFHPVTLQTCVDEGAASRKGLTAFEARFAEPFAHHTGQHGVPAAGGRVFIDTAAGGEEAAGNIHAVPACRVRASTSSGVSNRAA